MIKYLPVTPKRSEISYHHLQQSPDWIAHSYLHRTMVHNQSYLVRLIQVGWRGWKKKFKDLCLAVHFDSKNTICTNSSVFLLRIMLMLSDVYNYSLNRNTAPELEYNNKDTSNGDNANNKTNNFNYMLNKHTHTEHTLNIMRTFTKSTFLFAFTPRTYQEA